ncbi:MAG: AAA family ATPase [Acholeplasmataceae bacterium]|nr:AAA family ATPase [Acholeplasmataceae bacterium]
MLLKMIHIHSNHIDKYPFNLPLFQQEISLNLSNPVTILVGENGSGKSSLLKLIQNKLALISIKLPNDQDELFLEKTSIDLSYQLVKPKGFFFESIKFINYVEYMKREVAYAQQEINRVELEYKDKSAYTKSLAKSPFTKTLYELEHMYDKDLAHTSHGEAYLDFFSSRIKDNQIYLLDEPETPLSTQNQLTLMAMIIDATKRGCQFILATHSPVLAAIPNASIYEIKNHQFVETNYEDIESINLLKNFLNDKERFLRHFKDEK